MFFMLGWVVTACVFYVMMGGHGMCFFYVRMGGYGMCFLC